MMLKVPPNLREWKKNYTSITSMSDPFCAALHSHHNNNHQLQSIQIHTTDINEITVVTFQNEANSDEISVMIEPPLTVTSNIASVMKEGNVYNKFDMMNYEIGDELLITPSEDGASIQSFKVLIKRKNGSYYTFTWEKVRYMAVNTFIKIRNIHDDYLIVVRK